MKKNNSKLTYSVHCDIYLLPVLPFPFPYRASIARLAYSDFQQKGASIVEVSKELKEVALKTKAIFVDEPDYMDKEICFADAVLCIEERMERQCA